MTGFGLLLTGLVFRFVLCCGVPVHCVESGIVDIPASSRALSH